MTEVKPAQTLTLREAERLVEVARAQFQDTLKRVGAIANPLKLDVLESEILGGGDGRLGHPDSD
jgi:hypothetical protein